MFPAIKQQTVVSGIFFIFGVIFGSYLVLLLNLNNFQHDVQQVAKKLINAEYKNWFKSENVIKAQPNIETIRYTDFMQNNVLEAEYLKEKVTILCIILRTDANKTNAAVNTWARGCNKVETIDFQPLRSLNKHGFHKFPQTTKWTLLCNYLKKVKLKQKWVVLVYDYTFVILENLRYILAPKRYNNLVYLGHATKFLNTIYNNGKAGIVMSRATVEKLQSNLSTCDANKLYLNQEDLYLGKYLSLLNVTVEDTRDDYGLSMFHVYNWQQEFFPGMSYYQKSVFPVKCCSKKSITFKAIDAEKIHMYYYLLYQLQIFTIGYLGNSPAPTPYPADMVWKNFLIERNITNFNISAEEYSKLWDTAAVELAIIIYKMQHKNEIFS